MKRGFTLLELVVVIIILGILGTLGIQQYWRMVERARGAEARTILGQIRTVAAAYYLQKKDLSAFEDDEAGIGTGEDEIPSDCSQQSTHYFEYKVESTAGGVDKVVLNATRCEGTEGKTPGVATGSNYFLELTTNFTSGQDDWSSNTGY